MNINGMVMKIHALFTKVIITGIMQLEYNPYPMPQFNDAAFLMKALQYFLHVYN